VLLVAMTTPKDMRAAMRSASCLWRYVPGGTTSNHYANIQLIFVENCGFVTPTGTPPPSGSLHFSVSVEH
jgi:hypothetical protein